MLGLWGMALLTVGGFVVVLTSRLSMGMWITWNYVGGLFTLVLCTYGQLHRPVDFWLRSGGADSSNCSWQRR